MKTALFTAALLMTFWCMPNVRADPVQWHAKLSGFMSVFADIVSTPVTEILHSHPRGTTHAEAAETDRFIAMMYVTECGVTLAERYFSFAEQHDPDNEMTKHAREDMRRFLAKKSKQLEGIAIESERHAHEVENGFGKYLFAGVFYLLNLNDAKFRYLDALECDPDNTSAREGYIRTWMKQHGSWTFVNRLGY